MNFGRRSSKPEDRLNRRRPPPQKTETRPGAGLARALSKLGYCSRSQAKELIASGRVKLNGVVQTDPERPVNLAHDRFEVDARPLPVAPRVYLMLNKPRGLVTTASDEKGRATVYDCLANRGLPFVSPVGRLDQASEGLLLITNDTHWAARLSDPRSHLDKIYHVQIDHLPDDRLIQGMLRGTDAEGEFLAAKRVRLLRLGSRNGWLEVVLDEGKNRHIRRLLATLGVGVRRLIRVGFGPLQLGDLAKGQFRVLTREEIRQLGSLTLPQEAETDPARVSLRSSNALPTTRSIGP